MPSRRQPSFMSAKMRKYLTNNDSDYCRYDEFVRPHPWSCQSAHTTRSRTSSRCTSRSCISSAHFIVALHQEEGHIAGRVYGRPDGLVGCAVRGADRREQALLT